jgi:hypothetical protein
VYGAAGLYPVSVEVSNRFADRGSAATPSGAPLRVALKARIDINPPCPTSCIQPVTQLTVLVSSAPGVPTPTLNLDTITLGDNLGTNEAKPVRCNVVADRNSDGVQDVACAFTKTDVNGALATGAATFYLNGALRDGRPLQGRTPVSGL